jgi:hypothetical protein
MVDSWNGAVSGVGNLQAVAFTLLLAERFASFDEFIARSAAEIERAHRASAAARHDLPSRAHKIELYAVGWSEGADRPRSFSLKSVTDDDPAFVWREAEEWSLFPELDKAQWWWLHRQAAEIDVDYGVAEFEPVKHGVPLMEAQRRRKSDPDSFEGKPDRAGA